MHCLEIYGSTISWPSPFYDLYNILIFLNSTTYEQSVDADGFGVCFEMGKKCYWTPALNVPSLCFMLSELLFGKG